MLALIQYFPLFPVCYASSKILECIEVKRDINVKWINPFYTTGLFVYPPNA